MEYIIFKAKDKIINDKNNNSTIKSAPNILKIIMELFPDVSIVSPNSEVSDFSSYYNGNIKMNDVIVNISLKEYVKQKLYYLSLHLNNTNKQNLKVLEEIDTSLCNRLDEIGSVVITSYDSISEYYCNKIYKKLNSFERCLRQLMFNIYTFSYGLKYYEINFNENIKGKIKKNVRQNKDKSIAISSNTIEELKQSLYQLEYSDITDLLFSPKWKEDDEVLKESIINKISKSELDEDIISDLENLGPKSDWDRLFKPIVGDINNLNESINDIRVLRNKVAHCKFFRKNDYEYCDKKLMEMNKYLNKAIKASLSIDFQSLNNEYILESMKGVLLILSETVSSITKDIKDSLSIMINSINISMKAMKNTVSSINFKPLQLIPSYKTQKNIKRFKKVNGVYVRAKI